ncbi:MAG: hypothetical protein HY841_15730 [Bacteroidetes bacterium]|nr:hypothetical protein [Bacteroidota bacterium]
MARKKRVRVKIPRNAAKLIELAMNILKHKASATGNAGAAASNPLASIDMDELMRKTTVSDTEHTLALQLKKDSETAIDLRNHALGIAKDQLSSTDSTVYFFVKAIRDVLLGVYKGQEHKLGDYGFEVDESPKRSSTAPAAK